MLPVFSEEEKALARAMELAGLSTTHTVHKKIKGNPLYSVYYISANDGILTSSEVMIVEHPPDAETTVHLPGLRIMETATTMDAMRKVTDAVDGYFAGK